MSSKSEPTKKEKNRTNYSSREIETLEEEVALQSKYIFGYNAPSKKRAYESITAKINGSSGNKRSVESVKNRIRSDIIAAKSKYKEIRESFSKTGGGPDEAPELTDYEEILLSFIKDEQITGVAGGIDSSKKESFNRFKPPFKSETTKDQESNQVTPTKTLPLAELQCNIPFKKRMVSSIKKENSVLKDPQRRALLFGKVDSAPKPSKTSANEEEDKSLGEDTEDLFINYDFDNGLQIKVTKEELEAVEKDMEKDNNFFKSKECQTELIVDKNMLFQQQNEMIQAVKMQSKAIESQTEVLCNISLQLKQFLAKTTNEDTPTEQVEN